MALPSGPKGRHWVVGPHLVANIPDPALTHGVIKFAASRLARVNHRYRILRPWDY
jgi:hypothetical protein